MRVNLLLLALPLACNPAPGGDTGTTADSTAAASSSGAVDPTTTSTTGDIDTGHPHPSEDPGSTSSSSTTDASTSSTTDHGPTTGTTGITTGGPEFCQGWQGADGDPFLDLYDKDGNLLGPGSLLPLECGGQGLFMFGLRPQFGGFTPPGDILDVDLVVDVEGFNNNPEGHFYSAHPVGYYIACDGGVGGVYGVLPIFPLDNLDDLTALDGKPAQIHILMPTGDEPIAVDLDVVLSVVKDDSWGFCGG